MIWTPTIDALISRLRSEGLSCTDIARQLNADGYADVTRESVSGRFYRIKGRGRKPPRIVGGKVMRASEPAWGAKTFLPYPQWKEWNRQRRGLARDAA